MHCPNCGCEMDSQEQEMNDSQESEGSDLKSMALDKLISAMDDSMGEKLPAKGVQKIEMVAIKPKKKEE